MNNITIFRIRFINCKKSTGYCKKRHAHPQSSSCNHKAASFLDLSDKGQRERVRELLFCNQNIFVSQINL